MKQEKTTTGKPIVGVILTTLLNERTQMCYDELEFVALKKYDVIICHEVTEFAEFISSTNYPDNQITMVEVKVKNRPNPPGPMSTTCTLDFSSDSEFNSDWMLMVSVVHEDDGNKRRVSVTRYSNADPIIPG